MVKGLGLGGKSGVGGLELCERTAGQGMRETGGGEDMPKQSESHSVTYLTLFSLQPCKMSKVELNLLVTLGIQFSSRES